MGGGEAVGETYLWIVLFSFDDSFLKVVPSFFGSAVESGGPFVPQEVLGFWMRDEVEEGFPTFSCLEWILIWEYEVRERFA